MAKIYEQINTHREPRPRSERLRKLGGASGTGGGSVVISGASGGGSSGSSHEHPNKPYLDQITTDSDDYLYLTQAHEVEIPPSEEGGEPETEIVVETNKVKAGFADKAHDLDDDSPILQRFLSKVNDDIAAGRITFEQGLTALMSSAFKGGITIGDFIASLYSGKGAAIDAGGNAEVESLKVRSYMEVMELIVNRLSAIEGDQLLTEADTIESVTANPDGTFTLKLQEKWDGYFTAQAEGNVLKGIINTLAEGSGTYHTAWMRVLDVNTSANQITVLPYPDDETPAGKNFNPEEMMRIARWGNAIDESRQSCLYLSSTEGRIVKLTGVTKPIIDKSNYGATFGLTPEFLNEMGLPINPKQDYLYARGVVVQDLIRVDYMGKPIVTYVDRGLWHPSFHYYNEETNPETGVFETSDVWHMGCKWRCLVSGTTDEPRWNSTAWAMVEGNTDFTIEIESSRGDYFDWDNFGTELSITGRLYNQDITEDLLDIDIEWTRYSEDSKGNPRTASDNVWAANHAGAGKILAITRDDVDFDGSDLPSVLIFRATATLRDGVATAEFKYN